VRAALCCLFILAGAGAVACAGVGGARLMGALPFSPGVVAVAGSRSLPLEACAVVSAVASELVASGCSIVCDCCAGADAAVLAAPALPSACCAPGVRVAPARVPPARVPPPRWMLCSRLQLLACP
jgi:hypothetical protein